MNVIELFAGVGGFRIGLEKASRKEFNFVWANQWEPSTKKQDAYDIYVRAFGNKKETVDGKLIDEVCNVDIAQVPVDEIPAHDMLVGGFPCQDYSVASTLARSGGLEGKKGQLWWSIENILKNHKTPAKFLFLENVDRIINSPAKQRGRDFAVILTTLSNLGYIVEWRIINGAEYGKVQRRRRTYILAYKEGTAIHDHISSLSNPLNWALSEGTLATAFPVVEDEKRHYNVAFTLNEDLKRVSDEFGVGKKTSDFENTGIMVNHKVYTVRTTPCYDGKKGFKTIRDILIDEKDVPHQFYIPDDELPKWKYLKGSKREERVNKATGYKYTYTEGAMAFPDDLDKPSRTIITGEGGSGPSRFKHVVEVVPGHYRRLTPIELERLDGFPDNHTQGSNDLRRAFLMGNALIVSIVEDTAHVLIEKLKQYGDL